jgi:HEPN domain-containing protein
MQFRAEEYYQAALERMQQARRIHNAGGDYALAMYCAGLAVESLLRAFRWAEDTSFEGRHDLNELLRESGLMRVDDEYMRRKGASDEEIVESGRAIKAAMNLVIVLWHNNLRFASESRLKAFLNRTGKLKGIKGDAVKENSRQMLEASQPVISRGIILWASKKKS